MLGDVAPLKEMIRVSKEAGAMILVEEAHSMGFIGEHGRGVAEAQGVLGDVDFIIGTRSEEHTSELQSLMRISYAVFCLKKKIPHQRTITTTHKSDNQTKHSRSRHKTVQTTLE